MRRKQVNGKEYLFATYSNRFIDRDGEIITTASHEFNNKLYEQTNAMPSLWWFHDSDHVFDAKAIWHGFDNTNASVLFELSPADSAIIDAYEAAYGELTLSHGFQVLERDGKHITKHFTFEISLLPKSAAANYFTVQERYDKEAVMPIETLPQEQQEKLLSLVSPDVAKSYYEKLDETSEVLDQMGVETKEASDPQPETVDEVEEVQEAESVEAVEAGGVDEADVVALAEIVGAMQQQISELQGEIKSLKATEEKRKAKAAPTSLKSVLKGLRSGSAIETAKPVDGRTTIAKVAPKAPAAVEDEFSIASMIQAVGGTR